METGLALCHVRDSTGEGDLGSSQGVRQIFPQVVNTRGLSQSCVDLLLLLLCVKVSGWKPYEVVHVAPWKRSATLGSRGEGLG